MSICEVDLIGFDIMNLKSHLPEMDSEKWNAWINIYQGSDGSMPA